MVPLFFRFCHGEKKLTTPALLSRDFVAAAGLHQPLFWCWLSSFVSCTVQNGDYFQTIVQRQIQNLRQRLALIRLMQALGVSSFLLCTLSMFPCLFSSSNWQRVCLVSGPAFAGRPLLTSLYEIAISTKAIEAELEDICAGKEIGPEPG